MTPNSVAAFVSAAVLACLVSGCMTSGSSAPSTASVAAADPATTASAQAQADAASAPAGGVQLATVGASAPAAATGACSMPIAAVPPVPNFAAGMAAGAAENVGRNVTRNVGAGVAKNAIASAIPGFGAVAGIAAVDATATDVVKTAQDMRGTWTATDGAGCGCALEFAKPGLVVAKKVITPKGCRSPLWRHAARWNWGGKGFMGAEFVILGKDNKTVLGRLDMKSYDYYQGTVNGEVVTIWR